MEYEKTIVGKAKEDGDYSTNLDDYCGAHELVVTITLHEYRELIKDGQRRLELSCKNSKLESEVKLLNERIDQLTAHIAELESEDGDSIEALIAMIKEAK